MIRKVLIGGLAAVVIAAAGAGAYQAFASSSSDTPAASGVDGVAVSTNGNGYHGGEEASRGDGTGVPNPQANAGEFSTHSGTVDSVAGNVFTMDPGDGSSMTVQLGNSYYAETVGLALQEGDSVTVTGFWETPDTFTVQAIEVTAGDTPGTFVLREESGRPMWAGGGGQHGGGSAH